MAAPTSGQLTTAGYTQVGSTNVWNKTFGTVVVAFSIAQGASGSTLLVTPTGDVSAADLASVQASLSSLGYPQIMQAPQTGAAGFGVIPAYATLPPQVPVNLLAQNGLQSFGMSL